MSRRFQLIVLAIGTVLLLNFGLIFHFEQQQKAELTRQTEQGMDNQLWQFFQLTSEFQRLREAISERSVDNVQLRLDIFYSRIVGIEQGSTQALFPEPAMRGQLLQPLLQLIEQADLAVQQAPITAATWLLLQNQVVAQQNHVDQLAQTAREQYAKQNDQKKERLTRLGYFRVALSSLQVVLLLLAATLGLWVLWQREKQRRALIELNGSLLEARQIADTANATKSRFLAHISHEIRTPLTSILGYTERLRQNTQLTAQQKLHLSHIAHSGQHLLSLLNHVLDLSKSENGKLELILESLSLSQLKLELESMFALMAKEKSLQFEIELASNLPAAIEIDAGKLRQILINLIGNSMKFTDQGYVRVQITAELDGPECQLQAKVLDSGCGIAEHELANLFHPFEQTQSGKHIGGTGLGLALSRDFARLMGGDIVAHSQLGVGSEFTVSLIARLPSKSVAQSIETTPIAKPVPMGSTILVVEDQAVNRDLLCEILDDAGAQTLAAADGFAALAMVDAHPEIAQILMDYQMPGLDGLKTTAALRSKGFTAPIFLISASPEFELRKQPEFALLDGYLSKPYQSQDLLDLLGLSYTHPVQGATSDELAVDRLGAQQRLGFSNERFQALMEKGFVRLKDLELDFAQALQLTELDAAVRHAHSAKGIASQLGAVALAQQWSVLEGNPLSIAPKLSEIAALREQSWQWLSQPSE
jgi:signal transduction histidine kinase/DNA-binding response OmpR family regulator